MPAASKALRQKSKPSSAPESEAARRIAVLFHRRHETSWSAKEISAFKAIGDIHHGDLSLIETYYAQERAKGNGPDGGCHRRDLGTFLNNFTGELDRARGSVKKVAEVCEDPLGWREWLASVNKPYKAHRYAKTSDKDAFAFLKSHGK